MPRVSGTCPLVVPHIRAVYRPVELSDVSPFYIDLVVVVTGASRIRVPTK